MDIMDQEAVKNEFLIIIICKYCKESLPSFQDFIQHKQEKHSFEPIQNGKQQSTVDGDNVLDEESEIPTMQAQADASPGRSQVKIKFPFYKSSPTMAMFPVTEFEEYDAGDEMMDLTPGTVATPPVLQETIKTCAGGPRKRGRPRKASADSEIPIKNPKSASVKPKRKRKNWSLNGHRCPYCAEIFNSFNEKRKHEWIHTKPFECSICSKGFHSKGACDAHRKNVHTNETKTKANNPTPTSPSSGSQSRRIYKCAECPFHTTARSYFDRHKRNHSVQSQHKCPECTCSFGHRRGLTSHVLRFHPDSDLSKTMGTPNRKTEPGSSARKMRPCTVCLKIVAWNGMLAHRKLVHPDVPPFECQDCLFTTERRPRMARHRKHHNNLYPIKCLYCTASYSFVAQCNAHIQLTHPGSGLLTALKTTVQKIKKAKLEHVGKGVGRPTTAKTEWKCKYCGKVLGCRSHLDRHEGSHTLPFHCPRCPRRFGNKYDLKDHARKGHSIQMPKSGIRKRNNFGPPPKLTPCPVCGETCKGAQKLSQHLSVYHPSFKAYKCKHCDFATARRAVFHAHERAHRGGDLYPCPHCTAAFGRMTSRDKHVQEVHPGMTTTPSLLPPEKRKAKIHEPGYYNPKEEPLLWDDSLERSYDCYACHKVCTGNGEYERHFKEDHPGLKPYKCKDCPYGTVALRNITLHAQLHVETHEFQCDYCTASFEFRIARTAHHHLHLDNGDSLRVDIIASPRRESLVVASTKNESVLNADGKSMELHPVSSTDDESSKTTQNGAPGSQLVCDICDRTFPFNIALKVHRRKFHSNQSTAQESRSPMERKLDSRPSVSSDGVSNEVTGISTPTNVSTRGASTLRCLLKPRIHLHRIKINPIPKRQEMLNKIGADSETNAESVVSGQSEALKKEGDKEKGIEVDPHVPTRMSTRKSTIAALVGRLVRAPGHPPKRPRYEKVFVCITCNARFASKMELETHAVSNCNAQKECGDGKGTHQPEGCGQTNHNGAVSSLETEIPEELKEDGFKETDGAGDANGIFTAPEKSTPKPICHFCKVTFAFPGHLKIHMKQAHAMDPANHKT